MSKINFRLDAFYLRIEVKFKRVITNKEREYPVSFTITVFGYGYAVAFTFRYHHNFEVFG
jgi:hypothetical protein